MIEISDLSVKVDDKVIIQNLSLLIKSGALHVIMGQNGSGKSSLAHTLMGHPAYQVTVGSIMYAGQDLLALSVWQRSQLGIFLAFQQPLAIPGVTVFQFLKEIYQASGKPVLPNPEFLAYVQQLLDQVCLDYGALYKGLNDNFSGGEKKRLEIVQMLLLQPKLIILDEIDSGLDVDALRLVGKAISSYLTQHADASCIMITHYTRILEYVQPDYVHIMQQGTLIASGDSSLAAQIQEHGYNYHA